MTVEQIGRVLCHAESMVHARGWDRRDTLLVVSRELRLHRRPCSLEELADRAGVYLPIRSPADVLAVGYISESWVLDTRAETTADMKAALAMYTRGDATLSPRRMEARTMCAVDVEGNQYGFLRLRGRRPEPLQVESVAELKARESILGIRLTIPEYMRAIARQIRSDADAP